MDLDRLLSDIIRGQWAIDFRSSSGYLSIAAKIINGEPLSYQDKPSSLVISARTTAGPSFESFDDAPDGSVAIIPVKGILRKYDSLSTFGTESIANTLLAAYSHDKISAVILDIDSPGGSVNAGPPLTSAIDRRNKPVLAFGDQMLSLGYLIAAHTDKIIASNDFSAMFGSIGIVASFVDMKDKLANDGIKIHEIYPPESVNKNEAVNLALTGDYDLIKKEMLSPLAIKFQEAIRAKRGEMLNEDIPGLLTGKEFYTDLAILGGLVDEVGDLNYAISQAMDMAVVNNFMKS